MGGARQFTALLRKNVLLKIRRPKATCFELTLPLVLFLLLVWVRGKVDLKHFGPYRFTHNEIYPLANSVARNLADGSLIFHMSGSVTGIHDQITATQTFKQIAGNVFEEARRWAACESDAGTHIANALKPLLELHVNNRTLGSHFIQANATNQGEQVRQALEKVKSFNIAQTIVDMDARRRDYLNSDWPQKILNAATRVDIELGKLRDDLDSVNGRNLTRDRLENLIGDFCALKFPDLSTTGVKTMNRSHLAKELVKFQNSLNDSGISDWIRGCNTSETWRPVRDAFDCLRVNDVENLTRSLADRLRSSSAENIAESLDVSAWWLSFYLRTSSLTARLLGENPGNNKDMNWNCASNFAVPDGLDFRTAVAGAAFQGLKTWQRDTNPQNMAQDVKEALQTATDQAHNTSDSIIGHVKTWLDDITSHNASGIENVLLPRWSRSWETKCPLNKTSIGDVVEKMHSGCPFYRSSVRSLASENLTSIIAKFHDHLSNWTVNSTFSFLIDWHQKRQQNINATEVGSAVRRIWTNAQAHSGNSVGTLATSISDEIRRELSSGAAWNGTSLSCSRRLQTGTVLGYSSILNELLSKKILVAPYAGEARKVFEYMFVELAWSLATNNKNSRTDIPEGVEALLRCPVVRSLLARGADYFLRQRLVTFASEKALEQYARDHPKDVLMALVFRNADPSTGNFAPGSVTVDYVIRAHAQYLPQTSKILRISRHAMFGAVRLSHYPYISTFFAHLQETMGRAVARLQASRALKGHSEIGRNIAASVRTEKARRLALALEQFPAPAYSVDRFIRTIQHTMPMFMIMGWIYAVSLLVKEMVYEKQEKLRDVMRIQGLKTWVYWSSWFASAMFQMTVLVSITILILFGGSVLQHSDATLVFTFFMIYSMATVSLAMLISSFFSRAKVAAACAGLLYWVFYLPYSIFNRYEDMMSIHVKNALCLLSSCSMGIGAAITAKWELIGEGVNWSNFDQPPPVTNSGATPQDGFSLAHVMMMLLLDTVLYQVVAWYIEKVFPGTLGLPQPWYFPVLPSYWCPSQATANVCIDDDDCKDVERRNNVILEAWETSPPGLQIAVKIRELTKTFKGGKRALKGITLDMHHGTILGLLGHNGAGKSTTMAILTGLYPPTDGDVQVNGRSVRKDSIGVRRQLGVCLQHNALYENVTVEEHLSLFCCLKSVPRRHMRGVVDNLLHDTGLMPKRHAPTKALSGGMKRKLSIGIALSGGSSVVTLDEPTAGVDATSRRDIWQLLASHRSNKTMLLSTHFMDEADILSDRIAIIAEGQLTAIGSSMFLKRHYANSDRLTIVVTDGADIDHITKSIRSSVPDVSFAGSRGNELSYVMPLEARPHFSALFQQLQRDEWRRHSGVDTYGLGAATMEEVFLQASSVHESGLQGVVRNTVQNTPDYGWENNSADDVTTASGGSCRRISSFSTTSEATQFSDCRSEASLLGTTRTPVDEAETEAARKNAPPSPHCIDDDRPCSPQCMTEAGPSSPHCMTDIEPSSHHYKKKDHPQPDAKLTNVDDEKLYPVVSKSAKKNIVYEAEAEPEPIERNAFEGIKLWLQQFDALFRKRALSVRRDRRAWASQLLLPSLFILFALVLAKILSVKESEPALKLSTDMFIGTTAAGSVHSSMNQHIIPFGDMREDAWSHDVRTAFTAAKGSDDVIRDVIGRNLPKGNMSSYLMANHKAMLLESYGAVSTGGVVASPNITLWFKQRAFHAVPAMTSLFNDARFRMLGYDHTKAIAWSHPLPKSQAMLTEELSGNYQVFVDLTVALTVLLAMGFIPASFVVYLVHEKSTSGKHQQLLSGVSPMMYWIASFFFDMVNYLFPLVSCFLIFVCFQVQAYSGRNAIAIMVLLLTYGLCMSPCMYCLEPFFKVSSTAYVTLICVNIFTGSISVMATTVLDMVARDEPGLKPINDVCKIIFPILFPNYCLGRGMIDIAANHYINFAYDEFGVCIHRDGSCIKSPFSWDAGGKYVFHLSIMAPAWFLLRLLIEWGFCARRLRQCAKEVTRRENVVFELSPDEAVNQEADRVRRKRVVGGKTHDCGHDLLLISDLSKSFRRQKACCGRTKAGPTHAVRGVNVGVPAYECFGLLGVNGAGKTTTMRMITGDASIDGGDVHVCGWSVHGKRDRARRHLGYCPQFDALPDKLTVRESLALYARIRGVPVYLVRSTVNHMIRRMCLESHEQTTCEHLSGGNKRKLSTAIALIGEPDVVLLDEPSTGVDVGARRFLWDVIGEIRKNGHAVVLTSHSMEECEVLCTRLTIMVDGQFRCLGSPTQLKAKYGGGYTLTVKASQYNDGSSCRRIRDFVIAKMPEAVLAEESVGLFRYNLYSNKLNSEEVPLAEYFALWEHATKQEGELAGCVSDYSISQTSLEEVFLHFSQDATSHPTLTVAATAQKDAPAETSSPEPALSSEASASPMMLPDELPNIPSPEPDDPPKMLE